MEQLFRQIRAAILNQQYYLTLYASLTVPDICASMESQDGQANGSKYIAWFDKYIAPKYIVGGINSLNGETCYYYRCSMLHQGRSQHPKMGYSRILFVEPGATTNVFHNNIMNDTLNIDVSIFCNDVLDGAEVWLKNASNTVEFKKNYPLFMQRYPTGLPPYISGVSVIG